MSSSICRILCYKIAKRSAYYLNPPCVLANYGHPQKYQSRPASSHEHAFNMQFGKHRLGHFLHSSRKDEAKLVTYQDHHHEDNDEGSPNTEKPSGRIMIPMLGILGMFGGTKSSDADEERHKTPEYWKRKKMNPIETLIAKGVLSMMDQQTQTASELFHQALELSQQAEDFEQETVVLNLLATNSYQGGEYEEAEKLFIDLIKRLMSQGMEADAPPILELSLKLASIYSRDIKTHEKAMKGFKYVIDSLLLKLEDLLESEDFDFKELSVEKSNELALLGWSYDWFSKHLMTVKDYSGATEMMRRAHKICSKVLGPLNDQTLILLNNIGTTLAMDASPKEGRVFLKRAIEGAIESKSKMLASFYLNLGLTDMQLKYWDEAKRYCEYSLELANKYPDLPNSLEVIQLSQNCLYEVKRGLGE